MPIYTFDITLAMSARVRAESEERAREIVLKEAGNIDASLSSDGVAFSSGELYEAKVGDMWLVDEEELGVVHRSCGHSVCGQYYIDTGDARCQVKSRWRASCSDLSRWLGISKGTIYGWIRNGKADTTLREGTPRWGAYLVYVDTIPTHYQERLNGNTLAQLDEGAACL
jgi:hypothetical protein